MKKTTQYTIVAIITLGVLVGLSLAVPTGRLVIEPQFHDYSFFSEGLAPVQVNGKINNWGDMVGGVWGFIDKTGRFAIRPHYEMAHTFENGLARVWVHGKCGIIDKTGQLRIKPRFLWIGEFIDGLAPAAVR